MQLYRESQPHSQSTGATAHDFDVLKRNFQFIRDDEADLERGQHDWEVRLSVRYYRKLFREYALADLSRYREGKVGLRWRTANEVVAGKGQFVCGNKHCDENGGLHSYELLFAYMEHGETKRCLVKVRVCEACARKLFYRKLKEKEKHRKRRRESSSGHSSGASSEDSGSDRKRARRDGDKPRLATKTKPTLSIHDQCAQLNEEDTQRLVGVYRPLKAEASEEDTELRSLLV